MMHGQKHIKLSEPVFEWCSHTTDTMVRVRNAAHSHFRHERKHRFFLLPFQLYTVTDHLQFHTDTTCIFSFIRIKFIAHSCP